MKIIVHSGRAHLLLDRLKSKIGSNEIKTWEIKKIQDGIIYNHIPDQWSDKALIKPIECGYGLEFEIVWWKGKVEPDDDTKGYIIGRFTEILMVHCRDLFEFLKIR